jgi:hypothetical protein
MEERGAAEDNENERPDDLPCGVREETGIPKEKENTRKDEEEGKDHGHLCLPCECLSTRVQGLRHAVKKL